MDARNHKQNFFEANPEFREIEASNESTTIGEFDNIDDLEDEIWLLQCPKGTDIASQLQGQKLKLPGKSNINDLETVAVEFIGGQETHSFGYCNRKGRYALRLLPIRGSVFLRDRLKGNTELTPEIIESNCSGRMPLPDCIKVRHPLLGHQFEEKLELNKQIVDRLRRADENLSEVLREARLNNTKSSVSLKKKHKSKVLAETETEKTIVKSDDDDDDIQFVSESKVKHKKKKRKQSESVPSVTEDEDVQVIEESSAKKHKSKKSKNQSMDGISKDLQWLQQL